MQRDDFSIESAVLGRDFARAIRDFGGKTAGILLLQQLIADYHATHRNESLWKPEIKVPGHAAIPTRMYGNAERLLRRILADPLKTCPKEAYRGEDADDAARAISAQWVEQQLRKDSAFERILEETISGIGRKEIWFHGVRSAHVRSSTTIEDWRDDRHYGTFPTKIIDVTHDAQHASSQRQAMTSALISLIREFYLMKHHTGNQYLLNRQRLGVLVMPTIGDPAFPGATHVTVHSSRPEDPSAPVAMEVSAHKKYASITETHPRQLLFAGQDSIAIHQAQGTKRPEDAWHAAAAEEQMQQESPYDIDGQRCAISRRDIMALSQFAMYAQDRLGYPVNLEAIVATRETCSRIHLVQLRPVPAMPYRAFDPLADDEAVIAETPFVFGAYRITAPLVMMEYKRGYRDGTRFPEEYIIWHEDPGHKGHGWYYADPNCNAMLSPEGFALTHSIPLLPGFGPCRDSFRFIGVPQLAEKLHGCMQYRKLGGQRNGCGVTPFPITIESTGREGRVLMKKRDLPLLHRVREGPLFKD